MKKIISLMLAIFYLNIIFVYSEAYVRDDHGQSMGDSTSQNEGYGWLIRPNHNITIVNMSLPTNSGLTRAWISTLTDIVANTTNKVNKTFIFASQAFLLEGVEYCIRADAGGSLVTHYIGYGATSWNGTNINITNRCWGGYGAGYSNGSPDMRLWQEMWSYESDNATYTTPPQILAYNLSTPSGDCTSWPAGTCTTDDTTPTVQITTNQNSNCAIGMENKNFTYYSGLANRSCVSLGTKSFLCTIIPADELVNETSTIYIGCRNTNGLENSTSTSGALRVSIHSTDLETAGRNAIVGGVQRALTSGYTIYTGQRVYARNSANNQTVGVFDKVVKWMNKVWAFNALTGNQTAVNMFNITPVLYTLDFRNTTSANINLTVYNLITSTK